MTTPTYMNLPEAEWRLLAALSWMAEQYLGADGRSLDNMRMGAGERATELLAAYGPVTTLDPRNSEWTELGRRFLDDTWDE